MNETPYNPMPTDREAIAHLLERVRAHRLQRNWSQAEFARRVGLSRAAYQNFETGYGNITLTNLVRILGVLGFAANLAALVPPVAAPPSLDDMLKPARLRAGSKHPSRSSHGQKHPPFPGA
jgi:transcriptional regulator with XRE-family HTH domain